MLNQFIMKQGWNNISVGTFDVIKGLEASSRLSDETGHPGKDIRPCIATLMETPLSKGDFPSRNESAVVIASELYRIDIDYDSACARLELWNQHNSPPLKSTDLQRAFDNGYSGRYKYSCKNHILSAFCIEEMCPFANHVLSKNKKVRNHVFLDYGWQQYLSNVQVLIYMLALPYLEVKRNVGPGGLICANHIQIAKSCGASPRRIGENLQTLALVGLISYKVGQPAKWRGIASEIKRVIPIPRPTHQTIKLLKGRP